MNHFRPFWPFWPYLTILTIPFQFDSSGSMLPRLVPEILPLDAFCDIVGVVGVVVGIGDSRSKLMIMVMQDLSLFKLHWVMSRPWDFSFPDWISERILSSTGLPGGLYGKVVSLWYCSIVESYTLFYNHVLYCTSDLYGASMVQQCVTANHKRNTVWAFTHMLGASVVMYLLTTMCSRSEAQH